eukprot:359869-Chlamydomonas_euryale.AAC.38
MLQPQHAGRIMSGLCPNMSTDACGCVSTTCRRYGPHSPVEATVGCAVGSRAPHSRHRYATMMAPGPVRLDAEWSIEYVGGAEGREARTTRLCSLVPLARDPQEPA